MTDNAVNDAIEYRRATPSDLPLLGDLRWRLQTGDADFDASLRDRYVSDFSSILANEKDSGRLVHWIAETQDRPVAVMSVRIVDKVPKPGKYDGRWGYLTNVYTLPEYRGRGVGSRLLGAVKDWAKQERLELLVVWPSDDAYGFYRRAGFEKRPDPLVLDLDGD